MEPDTQAGGSEPPKLRIKLPGGLARTASSVEVQPDGSLMIELYDYSEEADQAFGNDVAYLIYVDQGNLGRLQQALGLPRAEADEALLQTMAGQFPDYYAVMRWLDSERIPYRKEFDAWA